MLESASRSFCASFLIEERSTRVLAVTLCGINFLVRDHAWLAQFEASGWRCGFVTCTFAFAFDRFGFLANAN